MVNGFQQRKPSSDADPNGLGSAAVLSGRCPRPRCAMSRLQPCILTSEHEHAALSLSDGRDALEQSLLSRARTARERTGARLSFPSCSFYRAGLRVPNFFFLRKELFLRPNNLGRVFRSGHSRARVSMFSLEYELQSRLLCMNRSDFRSLST